MESKIKYLSWDSDFFGLRIGRADISSKKELDQLKTNECDLLYLFAKDQLDIQANFDLFLVDKKVIFTKKISGNSGDGISEIVSVTKSDKAIIDLALLSGNFSRFKLDKKLSHKFEEMYKTWLERSLKREIASEVLAYQNIEETLGFVSIKKTDTLATIGLIAVNEKHQGKKIGSSLMKAVENWCVKNNVTEIDVATQLDNKQACAFYERNGYSIKQIDYIYHYYTN